MKVESKVDAFIKKHSKWEKGLKSIRKILIDTELEEDIKWGIPTYRLNGKNVISFSGFKNHFGIWFHNGSFLKDQLRMLENAQEGKTKGMRHLKYTDNSDLKEDVIRSYVLEAIQNQKDGKEVKPIKKNEKLKIPNILKANLSSNTLNQLTSFSNSKRNEYIQYITSAKKEETKKRRVEKIIPMIEQGLGLNDLYKKR